MSGIGWSEGRFCPATYGGCHASLMVIIVLSSVSRRTCSHYGTHMSCSKGSGIHRQSLLAAKEVVAHPRFFVIRPGFLMLRRAYMFKSEGVLWCAMGGC